ncbi:hypothetical protein NQD34_002274 [Periophthalmus magnuspinnatus]|nr:hypothetical protein NQD34_002274 [Periophthalmus magnuspinnatus]
MCQDPLYLQRCCRMPRPRRVKWWFWSAGFGAALVYRSDGTERERRSWIPRISVSFKKSPDQQLNQRRSVPWSLLRLFLKMEVFSPALPPIRSALSTVQPDSLSLQLTTPPVMGCLVRAQVWRTLPHSPLHHLPQRSPSWSSPLRPCRSQAWSKSLICGPVCPPCHLCRFPLRRPSPTGKSKVHLHLHLRESQLRPSCLRPLLLRLNLLQRSRLLSHRRQTRPPPPPPPKLSPSPAKDAPLPLKPKPKLAEGRVEEAHNVRNASQIKQLQDQILLEQQEAAQWQQQHSDQLNQEIPPPPQLPPQQIPPPVPPAPPADAPLPAPPSPPLPPPPSFQELESSTTSTTSTIMQASTFNYARPKQFIAAQSSGMSPYSPTTSSPSSSVSSPLSPSSTHKPFGRVTPPPLHQGAQCGVTQLSLLPSTSSALPESHKPALSGSRLPSSSPPPPPPVPASPCIQRPPRRLFPLCPPLLPPAICPQCYSSPLPAPAPGSPIVNALGLPKGNGTVKAFPKKPVSRTPRIVSDSDIQGSKDAVIQDLERKLRFKEERISNGQQEYKVSSFEQRLISEIEFRLERSPVEESDDDIQHDEDCIDGEAPVFDQKLKHCKVFEGMPVTFSCKVTGDPKPKVYWFKDGKQISKRSEHYRISRDADGTCSLHTAAASLDDDGNYTIMAGNPKGRVSCTGRMMVQAVNQRGRSQRSTPGHMRRSRSRSRDSGDENDNIQERHFRPHFLQAPGDLIVQEGRLCRMDCKVSGLPTPDLVWQLNGQTIRPDSAHKMLVRENGVHSLVIEPVTSRDAGIYTCIASNRAGQNSFNLELIVAAKEMHKAPSFVEKLQNTSVAEGHPVRLECRVTGVPYPQIFWKRENESFTHNTDRISMHQDKCGYLCMIIQPALKEDAGWYTVSAKNEAGIISSTARLDVHTQWQQPNLPKPKKVRPSTSRYAALTERGLDVKAAFFPESSPLPPGGLIESDDL